MSNGMYSVVVFDGSPADVTALLKRAAAPLSREYHSYGPSSLERVLFNLFPIPDTYPDKEIEGKRYPNREWMETQWGIERLLGGGELSRETATRGRFVVVTAYEYPVAWVDRVAADHRSLTFNHYGSVGGMDEAYHAVYRGGRRVRQWHQNQGRIPLRHQVEVYGRGEEWLYAVNAANALLRKRESSDLLVRRAELVGHLIDEWPDTVADEGYQREHILTDLNRAVEFDTTPAALVARGRYFATTDGGGKAALKDLNAAVRLDPTYADAYVARSQLRHTGMKYRASLSDANRAIRLDPDHPAGHMWRASSLLHLNRYPDALRAAERLLDLDPGNASGHMTRSRAHRRLGRYSEALAEMDEANCWVGLEFFDWWMSERAKSMVPLGRGQEVLDYCEKRLNGNYLPGGRTPIWKLRAEVHFLLGNWRKALADFNRVLREKPTSFPQKVLRVYALVQLGQSEKATAAVMTLMDYSRRKAKAFLRNDLDWALELLG